jgi:branched-subunit amino acid transport protein
MTAAVWVVVGAVGVATILIKGAGPTLLGGRGLPPRVMSVIELLAPAVLAALVVTQAVGGDHRIALDARLAGVGAGVGALALRAPTLVVLLVAAAVTAAVRALT